MINKKLIQIILFLPIIQNYNYQLINMDIDKELQMLQRQLFSVQQQRTNPLSERIIAEIMVKLYHQGFTFYPTTDGNQYITPIHLDQEIYSLVKERGKINISIMPQILNIGIDTIQIRIGNILKTSNLTRHGNNLISAKYFSQLIATSKQKLEIEGKIQLQEIALEHELNIKFVQQLITKHLEELKAELIHNQLRTKQYALLKKAQITGFLGALNSPISLDAFIKFNNIQKLNIEQIIQQLIKQKRLKGHWEGSYFIPQKFTFNQNKLILQFYENNGYIGSEMLVKKFLVNKPQEWISINLQKGYSKMQNMYFKPQKLQSFASQINSSIKSEGYVDLSNIFPVQFQQKYLNQFLENNCGIKDYVICNNLCYSNEWIANLASQFKQKLVWNIFFKKQQNKKDKGKKKSNKKQKTELITQQQLKEVLFNYGYADYTTSQDLATQLYPLIIQTIEKNQKQLQKQLAQNKGIINSNFFKYRTCKTIFRTEESLTRMINIISKKQTKGQIWHDEDFGPNQNDNQGIFSLIYYDAVVPKGWPALQNLKWLQVDSKQQVPLISHNLTKKTHLKQLLQIVDHLKMKEIARIPNPEKKNIQGCSGSCTYQFSISQKQKRYVIVDNMLPIVENKFLFQTGQCGMIEKAYAKLRYCYKGISSVGIQQLIMQITGLKTERYVNQNQKAKQMNLQMMQTSISRGDLLLLIGQGESQKNIMFQDKQTQFESMRLYCLYKVTGKLQIYPEVNQQDLEFKRLVQIFKNVVIISRQSLNNTQ